MVGDVGFLGFAAVAVTFFFVFALTAAVADLVASRGERRVGAVVDAFLAAMGLFRACRKDKEEIAGTRFAEFVFVLCREGRN